jgi:hypothetical protein
MGSRKESWSRVEELDKDAINGHTGLAIYRGNVGLRLLWGLRTNPNDQYTAGSSTSWRINWVKDRFGDEDHHTEYVDVWKDGVVDRVCLLWIKNGGGVYLPLGHVDEAGSEHASPWEKHLAWLIHLLTGNEDEEITSKQYEDAFVKAGLLLDEPQQP